MWWSGLPTQAGFMAKKGDKRAEKEVSKERSGRLNIRKQVIGENLLYATIWTIVMLVPFMNAGLMSEDTIDMSAVVNSWLKIVPFYIIFILNNHLMYPYLYAKNRDIIYSIISLVLVVSIFALLEFYETSEHIGVAWPFGNIGKDISRQHISLTVFPWWGNMIAAVMMLAANNILRRMYRSMQADEDAERLQRQNIQAEMYYLKHQINPHFFMNTLNNIHALVDINTESAKQAIIELSEMMRYVVYDTSKDAISLRQDIEFIENYIELMRIRYTDDVDIVFTHPKHFSKRVVVPPLIFIVFVENAFKHGVSYSGKSYIHIDIACTDSHVVAHIENSAPAKPQQQSGIGLENVRKRLDLIYGKDYLLKIEDEVEGKYCITLKIPVINDKMHSN